jgi:predicted porin
MQKNLIPLAIAALASSGAVAQVTFYGVLDAGLVRTTAKQTTGGDTKFTGVNGGNLSSNRVGLTAEEDLGGGVKAVGRFEFGTLNIDDTSSGSNGVNSTRQSYVGLASDTIGTLILGRLQGPGYDAHSRHATFASAIIGPFTILANAAAGSRTITTGGQEARVNNGVEYISPKLAGTITVKALAARTNAGGELSTTAAKGDVVGVGAEYTSGPLDVTAVVESIDKFAVVGTDTSDHRDALIGANFNFGIAKLFASYIWSKRDNPTGNDIKGKFFEIGVHVPLGKGTVKAAIGRGDTDHVSATDAADPEAATSIGLDYEHEFGKRTTAWVGLNRTKVGGATGIAITGVSAGTDKTIVAVGTGLRLKF